MSSDTGIGFFGDARPARYAGPDSVDPLAFRHYDPDRLVLGRRLEEHLRFAVCYWHNFVGAGADPFGAPTMDRPWMRAGDPMAMARLKADVAFEMFALLSVPYFCFHDRDIAPEGATLAESNRNVDAIADVLADKMTRAKVRLLWGTANLFSHPRYMAGAATNPDPDVFAYAAAQVAHCLEVTHRLGGQNYVLWGGREGYESLINTDMGREQAQLGRFLSLVVEHKHKIGFPGAILIEPKPMEPTKHQYDFDVAAVYGLLKRFGLENEVKVNIEVGHAVLAGHSFEHEIAQARALGLFGSLDINRNDYQAGWDTDHFPMNTPELALAFLEVLRAGGFTTGGLNFDAKLRRQSIDPQDLLIAHVAGMDACARGFLAAARMVEDGVLDRMTAERYAGWDLPEARAMLEGRESLATIAARVAAAGSEPRPRSGRQELFEAIVNRYV